MKDKKLQVFVSSTYTDLKEERQAAVEAILSSGHIPAGMELFAAGDESQMTVIERWIDESDIYLLILGGRYGSIDKKTGKSYIQLEYEYALQKNKPVFAVVVSEKALEKRVKEMGIIAIEQENPQLLKEFRSIVLQNLVRFWEDRKDIKIAIHETISDFSYRKELVGWTRSDKSVNTGFLAEEIARLTKENSDLRNKLLSVDNSTNLLYAGLTFSQMEELLKKEKLSIEKKETNLYDYLFTIAEELSIPRFLGDGGPIYNLLAKYKLVKRDKGYYSFTEDGHNFYIKALLSSQKRD